MTEETEDPLPSDFGPFRIVGRIGEGGMGSVFLAERDEPRQQVALKIVRGGIGSADVLARFKVEQRALALMNHDAIARIHEVGTTTSGQPYFAMEYVPGQPITRYCTERRLPLRSRIELMLAVCAGVQHAHQKGILHRDLKPGNVLVVEADGRAHPKIIDFGLARATQRQILGQSFQSEVGAWVGTLEYMSPEQTGIDPDAIDTRTDVYSLGIILYELITGTVPFPSALLRQMSLSEVQRTIRETEPPRPSSRLLAEQYQLRSCADTLRVSPSALIRELRGDLDWIVMQAIAKEPDRRYGSIADLMQDLRRFLQHEAVAAGPPSVLYRARKLMRRHRGPLLAVATVFVCLLAGIVAFARENRRARLGEQQARANEAATLYGAGLLAARDGKWQQAIDQFDRAEALGHADAMAIRIARIDALEAMGRADDAYAALDDLVATGDVGPHRARVRLRDGVRMLGVDDAAARAAIEDALDLHARGPSLLEPVEHHYARALIAAGIDDARREIAAALAAEPRHLPSLGTGAVLALCSGDLDAARRVSKDYRMLFPAAGLPVLIEALAASLAGRAAESSGALQEARRLFAAEVVDIVDRLSGALLLVDQFLAVRGEGLLQHSLAVAAGRAPALSIGLTSVAEREQALLGEFQQLPRVLLSSLATRVRGEAFPFRLPLSIRRAYADILGNPLAVAVAMQAVHAARRPPGKVLPERLLALLQLEAFGADPQQLARIESVGGITSGMPAVRRMTAVLRIANACARLFAPSAAAAADPALVASCHAGVAAMLDGRCSENEFQCLAGVAFRLPGAATADQLFAVLAAWQQQHGRSLRYRMFRAAHTVLGGTGTVRGVADTFSADERAVAPVRTLLEALGAAGAAAPSSRG